MSFEHPTKKELKRRKQIKDKRLKLNKKKILKEKIISVYSWKQAMEIRELEKEYGIHFISINIKHDHYTNPIRTCSKYIQWKIDVLNRDKNTCQICGGKINLHVHHIIPFWLLIKENNIKTIEEAKICKKLWDISNGIVLCKECHFNIRHIKS